MFKTSKKLLEENSTLPFPLSEIQESTMDIFNVKRRHRMKNSHT